MLTVLKVIGILILVIVVLYLLMIMPRMINRPDFTPFQGRLYAHRGLHDNETNAPENSLNAFQKAVDAGYGIELDVQLTKDAIEKLNQECIRRNLSPGGAADLLAATLFLYQLEKMI